MYREKHSIYRVWYCLPFQASTGGLGTYHLQIRRGYCTLEMCSLSPISLKVVKESPPLNHKSLVAWPADVFQAVECPAVNCLSGHMLANVVELNVRM